MRIGYGRKVGHGYVFVSERVGGHARRVARHPSFGYYVFCFLLFALMFGLLSLVVR